MECDKCEYNDKIRCGQDFCIVPVRCIKECNALVGRISDLKAKPRRTSDDDIKLQELEAEYKNALLMVGRK